MNKATAKQPHLVPNIKIKALRKVSEDSINRKASGLSEDGLFLKTGIVLMMGCLLPIPMMAQAQVMVNDPSASSIHAMANSTSAKSLSTDDLLADSSLSNRSSATSLMGGGTLNDEGALTTSIHRTITPHAVNDTPALPEVSVANPIPDEYRNPEHDSWVDEYRDDTKGWLNRTAMKLDKWFGEPDVNKPATANLRFLIDTRYNRYDGETIKPRVRGRIRLPTLERRLSVMIGDDELDNEYYEAGRQTTVVGEGEDSRRFDRTQAKDDNASLALRWSKMQESIGVETDADIGIRSGDDVYLRLRAERQWQHANQINTHFEQIYRYGTDSKHYLRSNLHIGKPLSENRRLVNHSYLDYTHNISEELGWGNSLYQHHRFDGALGDKTLNYGIHISGEIEDRQASLDTYGPFITYRQPVWRRWLFLQGELSYYNQKQEDRDHHLGAFMRIEAIF